MFKKIIVFSFVVILLSGCTADKETNKDVDKYLEQIKQLQASLEEVMIENEALQFKSEGKEEALNEKISVLEKIIYEQEELIDYLQKIVREINGVEDEYKILLNGIGIGDSSKAVEKSYGTDYQVESYFDEKFGITVTLWNYSNAEVSFVDQEVVEILLINDYYDTNFGVNVGDFAYQAINVCDDFFEPYISNHSPDSTPNLGWYNDSDGGTMIMYFNQEDDKFNTEVEVETARIYKIDLKSTWMFD